MISKLSFYCVLIYASLVCSAPGWAEFPGQVATDESVTLRSDIQYLASEELRGRSVADDTIDVAAEYVADRMAGIGLGMTAVDGAAFQPVSIPLEAQAGDATNNYARFQFHSNNEPDLTADLDRDMMPMSIGTATGVANAPVAFVGYGITAPNVGYDEYAGIDVRNHAVMILRKEPQASDPDSRFDGVKHTRHAFFATKVKNAIDNGAVAILFVSDAESTLREVQRVQTRVDGELARKQKLTQQLDSLPMQAVNTRATLTRKIEAIDAIVSGMETKLLAVQKGVMGISTAGSSARGKNVPVISLSRTMASKLLFESTNRTLEDVESQIDTSMIPQSQRLAGISVDLSVEIKPTSRASNNVIGVLDGRGDLAGETVIVGAHYDHVGMGGVGSMAPGTIAIHNGADDNASGTAALLATAANIKEQLQSVANHRRVVFIAFTGEERGLLGSKQYVRNPVFSLEKTVAMINLDMVGRLRDNELTVYGTGTALEMDMIVEQANASLASRGQQFGLFKVPSGYGPSDHQSFYEAGIPVLFYFTGLHNDYHRPSDDFDKIDFDGLSRITEIVTESCRLIAVAPERLRFHQTEKKFKMRWQMTAVLGVTLKDIEDEMGAPRVIVSGLKPGGPAMAAGIRIGDPLFQVGKTRVNSTEDVLSSLRGRRPGERVDVRVVRGDTITVIPVGLAARD